MYGGLLKQLLEREKRHEQVRVAVAGLGFIGRGICVQSKYTPGIKVSLIYCKNAEFCMKTLAANEIPCQAAKSIDEVNKTIAKNIIAVISTPELLYESNVDIIIDTTGSPEFGAELAYNTILANKHIIANPEMDICIGPYLKELADARNVIYTSQDGDEPGVIMNLYEYVSILGFEIIAAGKFKGFTNIEANPDTVKPWSDSYRQNPYKIASFADGSKMNIEMGLVCNATGFYPDIRGMHCQAGTLDDVVNLMRPENEGGVLTHTGVVDVVRGVEPNGGVFVIAKTHNAQIVSDMKYYKMGSGPYYLFYRPYHLPSVEILVGAANACLNLVPTIAPRSSRPYVDVAAYAKKPLKKGEKLDSIGGYCYYGLLDVFDKLESENYLPISLAANAVVTRDIPKGELIRFENVELSARTLLWQLREKMLEQTAMQGSK